MSDTETVEIDPKTGVRGFEVSHQTLTSQDIWQNKGAWYEASRDSEEYWMNQMDEEAREALTRIVTRSLERFHDSVDEWLPESLIQKGGEMVEVRFAVLLTDIDKEIDQAEEATSFQIKEAEADIGEMVAEYKGDK